MRLGTRLLAMAALSLLVVGCGGGSATGAPAGSPATVAPSASAPATPVASEVGSIGPFSLAGCPVSDPAFCTPAAAVAEAIVAGDTAAIVELSRPDVFHCADLDASIFTGCQSADVLEGHPIGTVERQHRGLSASGVRPGARCDREHDRSGVQRRRGNGRSACPRHELVRTGRSGTALLLRRLDRRTGSRIGRRRTRRGAVRIHVPRRQMAGRDPLSRLRRRVAGASRRATSRRRLRDLALGSRLSGAETLELLLLAADVQQEQPPSEDPTTAPAASQQGPSISTTGRTRGGRSRWACSPASRASRIWRPAIRSAMSARRSPIRRGSSVVDSAQCPEWHQPAIRAASSSGTSSRRRSMSRRRCSTSC